jgi:preprotein translocase subunit SecG
MTALIIIVLALIVILALVASMASSAATANQAQAAIEAARAAQIASAGQTAATLQITVMAVLLVIVVIGAVVLVGWMFLRMRRMEQAMTQMDSGSQQPAGKWLSGPNANWGRVGPGQQQPALQQPASPIDALVALMLADRIEQGHQPQHTAQLPDPNNPNYWR